MNVIAFNMIEHDVARKPVPTFRHHALGLMRITAIETADAMVSLLRECYPRLRGLSGALFNPHLAAKIAEDPGITGDPRTDAFLGAVGEHLSRRLRLGEPPAWTDTPERFLNWPLFLGEERQKAFLLAESPSAFRRRMIFTEAEPLRRARMPRDGRWWAYEDMRSGLTPGPEDTIGSGR